MSAENVSNKERGPYQSREERKYWSIITLEKQDTLMMTL